MINERYILGFIFILFTCIQMLGSDQLHSFKEDFREKRQVNGIPLVYPYGGTYKLLIGFASPVHVKDYVSLVFGVNFQYQYLQVQNVSEVSRYYFIKTVSREERDAELLSRSEERLLFYKSMTEMLEMKGMGGQDCVLRAICEAAQYPVENEALVGEIIHILLTPDYGHSRFEKQDPDWSEAMSVYTDAATAGRQMFNYCVLRAICEAAQYPVENEALVGEIIHILLTPDYGHSRFEKQDPDWSEAMSVYTDAATAGRQMFNCGYIYNGCPEEQSLLDLISVLRDE